MKRQISTTDGFSLEEISDIEPASLIRRSLGLSTLSISSEVLYEESFIPPGRMAELLKAGTALPGCPDSWYICLTALSDELSHGIEDTSEHFMLKP
jgi:hypothetical protein